MGPGLERIAVLDEKKLERQFLEPPQAATGLGQVVEMRLALCGQGQVHRLDIVQHLIEIVFHFIHPSVLSVLSGGIHRGPGTVNK